MSGELEPAELRRVLGHFATGVTVITGLGPGDEPVGFTCQSFASVSLDPPLVLFCAARAGRSWTLIRDSGVFTVNVLRHQQTELVERFGSAQGRRFVGLEWELSRHGSPSLHGVLMRVHAAVDEVHAAGDHDVVIGRVLGLEDGEPGRPMLFYRGRFTVTEPRTSAGPDEAPTAVGDYWG